MVTSVMSRGWRFLMLFPLPTPTPLRFVLRYAWLLVVRVSPFEEEGRGTGSWDCGIEGTTRLSTTRGEDEPRDCSDKVVDASGGSLSLRGGRTDDR